MRGHSKPQRVRTGDRRAEGGKAGDRWGNGEYSVSTGIFGKRITFLMKCRRVKKCRRQLKKWE